MRTVKLAALLLALAALPVPWFRAGEKSVRVYEIPVLFTVTYYVGLAASVLALVSRESMALLAAAVLLSTSPVYAYFALRIAVHQVSVAGGPVLCIASAFLYALEWARELKSSSELLSGEEADEWNGDEAVNRHP
ncbi:MAG: hypothetical protein QXE91_04740 [Thermofilaceae archaeon]